MIEWNEKRVVPVEGTTRVMEGYDNPCETCERWGDACEFCDVSVPIVSEMKVVEVTMRQDTLCGIPVGHPYEVSK